MSKSGLVADKGRRTKDEKHPTANLRPSSFVLRLAADRAFVLLVGLGLALRLAFALLPLQAHLLLLEDDAWMVTAIARNAARGLGISADGVHPTNGFHPLYPLTLGLLPYLLRPDDLAFGFSANLVLCALLSTLTALPLYGLLRRFAPRRESLVTLALWSLNPYIIRLSVNAMETSLALLLLLTLVYAWYTLDHSRPRNAVILGVLAALATLARLDMALMGAMIGVIWIYDLRFAIYDYSHTIVNRKSQIVNPLLYAATAALLLLPYFARNLLVFGALSPSSGRALAYMHSYVESFALTSGTQIVAYNSLVNLSWIGSSLLALLVMVAAIGLGIWLIPRVARRALLPIWLFVVIQTCYYAYLQQQGSPRYYVGTSVLLLVPLSTMLQSLRKRLSNTMGQATILVLTLIVIGLNTVEPLRYYFQQKNGASSQPTMYEAANWIAESLPPDAILAARNSGIYQYYSRHLVINIDGKLNHEIVPVLERRALMDYLQANHVGYLVDLQEVCGYVEFYSHQYSDAPAHAELSSFDKLRIYASMALRRLGLGTEPHLDAPVPHSCTGTFTADAPVYHAFPLPNKTGEAVTIFRLPEKP